MRYLMLIYDDEKAMAGKSQEEMGAIMGSWFEYTDTLRKSGKMLGGEALQPTSTATTVRVKDGKSLTTDGPFAETKEQLGGFYMIEAKDLDEAIDWAARMPHLGGGSVEVRPIMEFDNM
jgi:hypothetical protein